MTGRTPPWPVSPCAPRALPIMPICRNRRFHAEPIACPGLRAAAEPFHRRHRGGAARGEDRRVEGHRRLSSAVRRAQRGRGRRAAPAQGARGKAVRGHGCQRRVDRRRRACDRRRDRAGGERGAPGRADAGDCGRARAVGGARPCPRRRACSPTRRRTTCCLPSSRARRAPGTTHARRIPPCWSRPPPIPAASRWSSTTPRRNGASPALPTLSSRTTGRSWCAPTTAWRSSSPARPHCCAAPAVSCRTRSNCRRMVPTCWRSGGI